jgi:hypothetical protein
MMTQQCWTRLRRSERNRPKMGVEEIGPTKLTKTRLGKGARTPEQSTRRPTSSPTRTFNPTADMFLV